MALLRKGTVSMRRKLSKKQIGAMGMAVLMSAQGAAMAAETSIDRSSNERDSNRAARRTCVRNYGGRISFCSRRGK